MTDNYQSELAFKAYLEVQKEMGLDPSSGQLVFPNSSESMEGLNNIPSDAVLFGMAADGMPLYLHLRDPRPGPVLLLGERGSGKTKFLKTMMHSAQRFSIPSGTRFVALTDYPADFDDLDALPGYSGTWAAYENGSAELLDQLAGQVQKTDGGSPIIFVFDGLESILHMTQAAQDDLAYILTYGPRSLVWPLVSLNAEIALMLPDWMSFFRTRIYGRISNPRTADELTPHPGAALNSLFPGSQFSLRHSSRWLKFWLPNLSA